MSCCFFLEEQKTRTGVTGHSHLRRQGGASQPAATALGSLWDSRLAQGPMRGRPSLVFVLGQGAERRGEPAGRGCDSEHATQSCAGSALPFVTDVTPQSLREILGGHAAFVSTDWVPGFAAEGHLTFLRGLSDKSQPPRASCRRGVAVLHATPSRRALTGTATAGERNASAAPPGQRRTSLGRLWALPPFPPSALAPR